jgi:hypothetical protein
MALDMTTALTINAKVTGQNQISGLTNGLKGVSGASDRAAGSMSRLRGAAAGAMGALRSVLPFIGTAAVIKFGKDTLDAADAMSKLSQRTGVAAPTLDKFRKVAELNDTSIEALGKGFTILSRNVSDAVTKGTGPAADAFEQLGIKLTNADGSLRAVDDVMLQVSDRFKDMEDGTQKAALASQIFGQRLGSDLIPLLNNGGDAVRDMSTALTQELADKAATVNDRLETLGEKFNTLGVILIDAAIPAFETLLSVVEAVQPFFEALPGPIQAVLAAVTALGAALAIFGPILTPIIGLLSGLPALLGGIPALLAGWAGAIGPVVSALLGLGKILIAVFSGPVGWVALAVAAGVAIFAFRDQIAAAFKAIGDVLIAAAKAFYETFVRPVIEFAKRAYEGIVQAFQGLARALAAPFRAVADFIRGYFNSIISSVERALNGAIKAINFLVAQANRALSKLRLPTIPYASSVNLPRFAQGGVVDGPTLAMVGEGGEREYIVPESKMAKASANYLMGARGAAVIPAFAQGGVVNGGANVGNTSIQITTGPVLQQEGRRYVTMNDLEAALNTLASSLLGNNRSAGGRRFQGV